MSGEKINRKLVEMKNFKILAIKPLLGCEPRFRKSIHANQLYCFYNNYEFIKDAKNNITKINKSVEFPDDYYSFESYNSPVTINISAIVGKNGSGKSSIFELMYYASFVIGHRAGIIDPSLKFFEDRLQEAKITDQEKVICAREKSELETILKGLKVSIYFELNDSFYCLTIDGEVKIKFLNGTLIRTRKEKLNILLGTNRDFFEFLYYSISINYSLHGLNSKQIGFWVDSLFHKNDGYQTPLVINPMRTEGNVDVNSEFHLAQTRMLSNLTSLDSESPTIVNNKTLSEIEFIINPNEIDSLNGLAIRNVFQAFEQKHTIKIFDFFAKVSEGVIGFKIPKYRIKLLEKKWNEDAKMEASQKYHFNNKPNSIDYDEINYLLAKYAIRKVFKIVSQYKDYEKYRENHKFKYGKGQEIEVRSIKDVAGLILKLKKDTSHITYKLRQALFSIKEEYFKIHWEIALDDVTGYNYCYESKMDYPSFRKKINDSFDSNKSNISEKIVIIPCALVKPKFKVEIPAEVNDTKFHTMSSGELQFAFVVHTLYYHIQNINSVIKTSENKKIKYRNINLMLDETELYFHPEFQQGFIDEFLTGLKKYRLNEIDSINIMFLTHSPFILSDIPAINLLKLENGLPIPYDKNEATLGANIHSLLANDFYLSKGFIGKRARLVINDLFNYLQDKKVETYNFTESTAKLFIKNIGEPILKHELSKLYDFKFPGSFELEIINSEMARLEKLKERHSNDINTKR